MSTTGIDAFDKTIQVTNTWLNEIMADHGPDRQVAWHVLSAVLHVLRDRLTTDLSANLGAQLPLLVRGTYYDQFEPSRQPDKSRSLDEFLHQVQQELRYTRPVDSKEAVRSVFKVLSHYIDPCEVRKVRLALPGDVRDLWPDPDIRH
ncbi:DUF2267 domain-containing protein [Mesorhizobium sp. BAC0120]|uniref:DUF2267 domain-containing protein n=1 Tax=Mesorhizobium sp. BAC0120 TaxID=3090670 RepID=UPI00298D47CF|nr:DUF2267 domain-containing protein [Mesorhizobium sp. BAC0120]MDW6021546.1 DUF2267 domain-containing protein [Mesorhizobium sp. BAC0120]